MLRIMVLYHPHSILKSPFLFTPLLAQLMIDDHFEVTEYLEILLPQDLIRLGGALGLKYSNVKMMNPLCGDMVLAWLNQQDNVMKKSGKPTWESLMKALRTIGQEGLAQKIAQGSYCQYWTRNYSVSESTSCGYD